MSVRQNSICVAPASAINEFERLCPGGVLRDVPLAQTSRWRIGGIADVVVRPSSVQELAQLRAWLHARGLAHVVIGATSNLLFADQGLRVPCLQIGDRMAGLVVAGNTVEAGAGVWVPGLARRVMQASLTGAEHICGIPGTLGGLICMNGGSQRKGIGSAVVEVESVDTAGEIVRRGPEQCGFAYRSSVFQHNDEIVNAVRLRFEPADRNVIRREMLAILADRGRKFPQKMPNCGSVFVSDPAMYAQFGPPGALIERLGFKGLRCGGAQVSSQHANFIVNTGHAKAAEVIELIVRIGAAVQAHTGYVMQIEARYVTPDGAIVAPDKVLQEML